MDSLLPGNKVTETFYNKVFCCQFILDSESIKTLDDFCSVREDKSHDPLFIEVSREQWIKSIIDWNLTHINYHPMEIKLAWILWVVAGNGTQWWIGTYLMVIKERAFTNFTCWRTLTDCLHCTNRLIQKWLSSDNGVVDKTSIFHHDTNIRGI